MGNGQSQMYSASFQTFIGNYEKHSDAFHKYEQDAIVYRMKSSPQTHIILFNRAFDRTDKLEASIRSANYFKDFKHPNLCNILQHSEKSEFNCLNQNFVHSVAVEYPLSSLQDLIYKNKQLAKTNRLESDTTLSESHSWYILKSLISVSNYMYKSGLAVGDVFPGNVLIDNDGEVKLLNFYMTGGFRSSLENTHQNSSYRTTYPPEYLRKLKILDWSVEDVDPIKADVFSIGMTLLCATSNEYVDTFYDWSTYSISFERVVKKINKLKEKEFGSDFTNLLVRMMDPEFMKRPNFAELSYLIEQKTNPGRKRGISTVLGLIKN